MSTLRRLLPLLFCALVPASAVAAERSIAVTVDDLPVNSLQRNLPSQRAITEELVAALVRQHVPAIGFVNEGKLEDDGEVVPQRRALLEHWLSSGLELGNHGHGHLDLNRTPLVEYQRDILRGERVTRPLMEAAGHELVYFRHPYLHAGQDLATRDALRSFLVEHDYREAPVTVDNSEWIFARAYDQALTDGERELAARIGDDYVPYMMRKVEYYERQSRELFGREIAQVLLIHANRLNADRFDELADALRAHGYRFVPLGQALEDPAYDSEDRWAGPQGISWIHRWALTRGVEPAFFRGEPLAPEYVKEAAGVGSE